MGDHIENRVASQHKQLLNFNQPILAYLTETVIVMFVCLFAILLTKFQIKIFLKTKNNDFLVNLNEINMRKTETSFNIKSLRI